jgi:hypothetical protein
MIRLVSAVALPQSLAIWTSWYIWALGVTRHCPCLGYHGLWGIQAPLQLNLEGAFVITSWTVWASVPALSSTYVVAVNQGRSRYLRD